MPTCNICKYAGRPIYKSPCSECKEFSEYEYENKKTNADRVRAMSDEELAKIFGGKCICHPTGECEKLSDDCTTCWLEWLKQPAE